MRAKTKSKSGKRKTGKAVKAKADVILPGRAMIEDVAWGGTRVAWMQRPVQGGGRIVYGDARHYKVVPL